jgi:hypothetical protein
MFNSNSFQYKGQKNDRYKFKYVGNPISGRTRPETKDYLLDVFIKELSGLMSHDDIYYTVINWEDYNNSLLNLKKQSLVRFHSFKLFEKFINNSSVAYKGYKDGQELIFHVDFLVKPSLINNLYAKIKEVNYREDYVKFDNMLFNRGFMEFEDSGNMDHFTEIPHDFINASLDLDYVPDHEYVISDELLECGVIEGENFALHWLNSSFKDPVFNKVVMGYELLNLKLYDKAAFNVGKEGSGKSIKSAVIKALSDNTESVNFERLKDGTLMLKMLRSRHLGINEVKGESNRYDDLTSQLKTYISRSDTITDRGAYQRETDIKPIKEKPFINLYGNETFSSFDDVLKKKFWLIIPAKQFRDTPLDIKNLEKLICEDQSQLNIVVNECINTFLSNNGMLEEINVEEQLNEFNKLDSKDPHKKWIMENIDFVGDRYEALYSSFVGKWKQYLEDGTRFEIDDMPRLTIPDAKEDYKEYLKRMGKSETEDEINNFFQRKFSKRLKECFPDAYGKHHIGSYQISANAKGRLFFQLKKDIVDEEDNSVKEHEILKFDLWKSKQDDLENFDNDFEIWNYYLKTNNIPITLEIQEILNDLETRKW